MIINTNTPLNLSTTPVDKLLTLVFHFFSVEDKRRFCQQLSTVCQQLFALVVDV